MAAVSGTNGTVLWERPLAQDVAHVKCAVPQTRDSKVSSACVLVGRLGSFMAVNFFTGQPPGEGSGWLSLEGSALALSQGLVPG